MSQCAKQPIGLVLGSLVHSESGIGSLRIIIFSDLHANLEALGSLLSAEKKPDAYFFLGDVVGYGPDPGMCLSWMRSNVQYAVRGDHDHITVNRTEFVLPPDERELALATRDHTLRQLRPADLAYLAAMPTTLHVELGNTKFFLVHAKPSNSLTSGIDIATASENTLRAEKQGVDADVIFVGHTHVPAIRRVDNTFFVNPGSLGQPCHGLPSATYAVWDDGHLQIHHIDYDPHPTIRKLGLIGVDPDIQTRLAEILERGM
jgi:putative phosphoesterase